MVGGSDSRMALGGTDDLATLAELEENSLLEELQARYNKDFIYVMFLCYVLKPCYTHNLSVIDCVY